MQNTKNDLSHAEVKLDYEALLQVAIIAFVESREALSREINRTYGSTSEISSVYLENLRKHALNMAISGETMHVLQEGLKREIVEVINKDKSKVEQTIA